MYCASGALLVDQGQILYPLKTVGLHHADMHGAPSLKAVQVSPEGECASAARVMKAANKGRSALSWASFLATQALALAAKPCREHAQCCALPGHLR